MTFLLARRATTEEAINMQGFVWYDLPKANPGKTLEYLERKVLEAVS